MNKYGILLLSVAVLAVGPVYAQEEAPVDIVTDVELVVDESPSVDTSVELPTEQPTETTPPLEENLSVADPAAEEGLAPQVEVKQVVPYSGQYYDADAISGSKLTGTPSPTLMDPRYQPGTRYVVARPAGAADSVKAQMIAADRALKLGRYVAALDMYEGLYKKNSKSRDVLMGLAVAQQQNGFTESAIATYEELLKIDPNNTDATVNMLGLIKERYPAVAYRKLRELWENNGSNPAIAAQLGLTSAQNGNLEGGIKYLAIAASLEPNNASHFYNLAVLADRAGFSDDAVDYYERSLEVDASYGGGRSVPRDQIYDRLSYLRRL